MDDKLAQAMSVGFERVAAWSDVLDRINVFPVPDGDTGRNLVISLTPLRVPHADVEALTRDLLIAARGNSGNIASRFLSGFLDCNGARELGVRFSRGRDLAYGAVYEPKQGTMLTLFDAAVESFNRHDMRSGEEWAMEVLTDLEASVMSTTDLLPELSAAGVVDAGALGMFIFYDGLLKSLVGGEASFWPIAGRFKDTLNVATDWQGGGDLGYCLDVVLEIDDGRAVQQLAGLGREVVAMQDGNLVKVHLHVDSESRAFEALESIGHVLHSSVDDMGEQVQAFARTRGRQAAYVMTDAAGSVTREDAAELGIILLDSYVNLGSHSVPETRLDPEHLYGPMREGVPASTSQASVFERRQHYEKAVSVFDGVLYLCVGSVYTGNYEVVLDWKRDHDPEDRMTVIDTGTASGRLGLTALRVARQAVVETDARGLAGFAHRAISACQEYIFLDKLQYLAAGGRMSKTGAFMGDMFGVKPIVTPAADGATKVGVVRKTRDQVKFAVKKLEEALSPSDGAIVMLEYTDNRDWLQNEVRPRIEAACPKAEILVRPLSFTTGVHCGPGTWAVAFLPPLD